MVGIRLAWLALLVAVVGWIAAPVAAAVSWAPSSGLLVSELVTGGASASDEFIEIYNASAADLDLAGLELVYVTSSGSTVTRKQTWTALVLGSHRHLFVANSAGVFAPGSDGTYAGGLSATGGSVVLRTLGGVVIDSLSWGDAASSFVETHAGAAPPAGSSLERKPGGASGNAMDTNDNSADAAVNASPVAQNLAAAAVPVILATPTGSSPTPAPTPTPVCAWAPMPTPLPFPTYVPSPTPSPIGSVVTLNGQLISATQAIDAGRTAYLDYGTGGIALYLATADWPLFPAGTYVSATGVMGERHGETTLALGSAADLVYVAPGLRPAPIWAATGLACESLESRLVAVQAWVTGAGIVDDGTGPLNVIVPSGVLIAADDLAPGNLVELVGVLSQIEQSSDGYGHYALIVSDAADVFVLSRPATITPTPSLSPTPTPTPTPSLLPTLTPSPTPTPTASPTASPSAAPTPAPIADARLLPIGAHVLVDGVVTVAPGRILGESVIGVQDATAGIYVRLPAGSPEVAIGQTLEVGGLLAAPYGNLEIRPAAAEVRVIGTADLPALRSLAAAQLGEATEGLLARIEVTIDSVESSTSGSLTLLVHDDSGSTRVFFHAPLGAVGSAYKAGQRIAAVGLVGDRLGLYRLWPRDLADVTVLAEPPTPSPKPTTTPKPTSTAAPSPRATATPTATATSVASVSIADAVRRQGQTVSISGVVTTRPGLLDADAQRVTLQDASGAILVRLPADFDTQPGRRVSVIGAVGTYYGAPQLTAASASDQGTAQPDATEVRAAPISPALEWRLVTITGKVDFVHKDGGAWRAELTIGNGGVPIVGLERSGIPSTALEAGRTATITGIVKRAYPTASDQRLSIVPRSAADIRLGAAPQPTGHPGGPTPKPGSTPRPTPRPTGAGQQAGPSAAPAPGSRLAVGGAVQSIDGPTILLADANGTVTVQLVGDAVALASTLRVGDLINATGIVGPDGRVTVSDPGQIQRVAAGSASAALPTGTAPAIVFTGPQIHQLATAEPSQIGPVLALVVIFGLVAALVMGALAWKLGWLNRVQNWPNRLKRRFTRI